MNNFSNDPYSQPTVPGQFGPLPQQPTKPPKPPLFDIKARRAYYKQYPPSKKKQFADGCGRFIGILLLCGVCSAIRGLPIVGTKSRNRKIAQNG